MKPKTELGEFILPAKPSRWVYGVGAALIILWLAIYPLIQLRISRGSDWHGSFAYLQGDELAYAAYVHAIALGQPRRSNPYTRDQDRPGAQLAESFFSIQFLPAYATAALERTFKLSTSGAFAVVMVLVALSSALVLFWLILAVTEDFRLAATGVLFVLCLGSVPTLWGLLQILRGLPADFSHLRFLRRYVPGLAFPFFLAFCTCVWRSMTTAQRTTSYIFAASGGLLFFILVYSYFFYWTAAIAWMACLLILWVIFKPEGWQQSLRPFGVISIFGTMALLPYLWLLSRRNGNEDAALLLLHTRVPDLLRVPQLVALISLILLALGNKYGRFSFRRRPALFSLSFLILPFALFNQQILTGLSLQPVHYEIFVTNYGVLLAIVLIAGVMFGDLRGKNKVRFNFFLLLVTITAIGWATFEVQRSTAKFAAPFFIRDGVTPAALRLAELKGSSRGVTRSEDLILAPDPVVADYLPTIAPQPLLWAPHMYAFASIEPAEEKARLLKFLYYTGIRFEKVDAKAFEKLDADRKFYFSRLLSKNRLSKSLTNAWKPVSSEEYETAQQVYSGFMTSFDLEVASHPTISYVLVSRDAPVDFSNLDKWYERNEGERIGTYILYNVKLRRSM